MGGRMLAAQALTAVLVLAALAFVGGHVPILRTLCGGVLPLAAFAVFVVGVSVRVIRWSLSPVPFRIPTTCGQQESLPWIKSACLDNPSSSLGAVARMLLEVGLFRSLFRNNRAELRAGHRLVFGESKLLWIAALAFHWSVLVILLRHLRFFLEPVPAFVQMLASLDGFFQVGVPAMYVTDVAIVLALAYLLWRRLCEPQVRYISLFADYFPIFLLLGIVLSGILMRYAVRVEVVPVKELALGLATLSPAVSRTLAPAFFVHLALVCVLVAYFPFSKLMHMGGIFLSPTRNLANTNRRARHVNPWNAPVRVHTYGEWEDEFRDKIKAAGLPLERD